MLFSRCRQHQETSRWKRETGKNFAMNCYRGATSLFISCWEVVFSLLVPVIRRVLVLYIFFFNLLFTCVFSLREQPPRQRYKQHTAGTQWGKDSTGLMRNPAQNEVETPPQRWQRTTILVIRYVDMSWNQTCSQALPTQRGWRTMMFHPKARLTTSISETFYHFMKLRDWIITLRFVVL